jgi:hypothetical protein
MYKTIFFYCFKVWVTSVLLAPIFWFLSLLSKGPTLIGFVAFYAVVVFYGLLLSFPSMCLLWAGAAYLFSRHWTIRARRIILCVWASMLTVTPFIIIFRHDDATLSDIAKIMVCYLITILAGLFGTACFRQFLTTKPAYNMSWANHNIEKLKAGDTVQFRPRDNSMKGKIESRQLSTFYLWDFYPRHNLSPFKP